MDLSTGKKVALAIGGVAVVAGAALFSSSSGAPPGPDTNVTASDARPVEDATAVEPTSQKVDLSKVCRGGSGATVPAGSADEADNYYASMGQEIGLRQFNNLDGVLIYLGYPLSAKRLQDAPPSDLMNPATLGVPGVPSGAVLAARFFAPKITDVSAENTPAVTVGWRKLVRLNTLQGSEARKNRIDSAFILFNFFAPIGATDPFDGADSANTQVMLITSTPGMSPVYWLDYGLTSKGALLSKALDAFFDAGHGPAKLAKRSYFVPCACIACHGGLQLDVSVTPPAPLWKPDLALANYLDTDHWFDRVQPGEDFAALKAPVIDPAGFDVLKVLNAEMRDQNQRVQPGSPQHRAAAHWVELHQSNANYVNNLVLRALPSATGQNATWNGADPIDGAELKRLNHYCFRCHGSVEFDIFDKSMVLSLRSLFMARLRPRGSLVDDRATMPPDRDLQEADRSALLSYSTGH
jgi:hypothetical protein